MRLHRKTALIGSLVLVCTLFFGMTRVQAKATPTQFYSLEHLAGPPGIPERAWVEDGTLYLRNMLFIFVVFNGDLNGIVEYHANWNVDLSTGEGVGWGKNVFNGVWLKDETFTSPISWHGHSVIKVTGWGTPGQFVDGIFIAHGEEGLEGMLIKGIFQSVPNSNNVILAGTILNPHG